MWQRFSERGRKTVFYAQEEAQKFGEGYVSTEHLLLGLIRLDDCAGCRILQELGVSLTRVRQEIERQLPRGDARPSQDMTLTPRAKRVIDLAFDEAKRATHNYIGTEHLLLALIREGDGLAGRVLAKLGIELKAARSAMGKLSPPSEPVLEGQSQAADPAVKSPGMAPSPVSHLAFLMGASIQEHLMLNLLGTDGPVRDIVRAQVTDVGALQLALWKEIIRYAERGPKRIYPEIVPTLLETARTEAEGGEVKPIHLLLALLDPQWKPIRFGHILAEAGLTLERSRELAGEL